MIISRNATAYTVGLAVIFAAALLSSQLPYGAEWEGHDSPAHVPEPLADAATGMDARYSVHAKAKFPLKVSKNNRYLVDASGKPFLLYGDSAWSLIAQLKRPAIKKYLDDRRNRGFNTILVNLLEHRFATNAPRNAYGDRPFLIDSDFSKPNEKYFAHADWVIKQAAKRGMLVLLAPAYLGFGGDEDGWYEEMKANGTVKLRKYGKYAGKRYKKAKNIVWVDGGDYDPPEIQLVSAVAEGIKAKDPGALHTMHCAPESSAFDCAGNQKWLDLNNVYTYGPVIDDAQIEYARKLRMPFFLMNYKPTKRSVKVDLNASQKAKYPHARQI